MERTKKKFAETTNEESILEKFEHEILKHERALLSVKNNIREPNVVSDIFAHIREAYQREQQWLEVYSDKRFDMSNAHEKEKATQILKSRLIYRREGQVPPRCDILKEEFEKPSNESEATISKERTENEIQVVANMSMNLPPALTPTSSRKRNFAQSNSLAETTGRRSSVLDTPAKKIKITVQKGKNKIKNTQPKKEVKKKECICPICSVEWKEGANMVACDTCDNWFHYECVGLTTNPDEDAPWYCKKCLHIIKSNEAPPALPQTNEPAQEYNEEAAAVDEDERSSSQTQEQINEAVALALNQVLKKVEEASSQNFGMALTL
uniref:PHD-type domain-containing protein n=1 Tax=Acrobeloides nanus TaxID=290746 RepID=A0A914CWA2_9BILA